MTRGGASGERRVGRWEPDARGRLERAAFALYAERGFDDTTVAQIAERAGLTERTFFRHFADKREVLFAGASDLQEVLMGAVVDAPSSLAPLDAVAAGLEAIGARAFHQGRREFARQRQAIIAAHVELRERELIKLASLSAALSDALRRRGVGEPDAGLAAEVGIAVFRTAFDQWIGDADEQDFPQLIRESLDHLKTMIGGG